MSSSTPRQAAYSTHQQNSQKFHLRKSFNDMQNEQPVQTTNFGSGLNSGFDETSQDQQAAQRASIEINKRNVYMQQPMYRVYGPQNYSRKGSPGGGTPIGMGQTQMMHRRQRQQNNNQTGRAKMNSQAIHKPSLSTNYEQQARVTTAGMTTSVETRDGNLFSEDGVFPPGHGTRSSVGCGHNVRHHGRHQSVGTTGDLMGQNSIRNEFGAINLESDALTFSQARSIKEQVARDCQLLKNRVRMLKAEMDRARKKIEQTKKMTEDIRKLKADNDEKYIERVKYERLKEEQNKPNKANMERRRKLNDDIKEKKFQMFMQKRQEVDNYKKERAMLQEQKTSYMQEKEQENYRRKLLIRQQLQLGQLKKQEFYEQKRLNAMRDKDGLMGTHREEIYSYEREAEELEMLEAELLHELQETQQRETTVFGELKNALIDSSIPKKMRASFVTADQQSSVHSTGSKTGTAGGQRHRLNASREGNVVITNASTQEQI